MTDDNRSQVAVSPERPRALTFEDVFRRYDESMTAVRDFFSHLRPLVSEMEKAPREREVIVEVQRRPTEKDLKELKDFLATIDMKPGVVELPGKVIRIVVYPYPPGIHRELLNRSILMCLVSHFEVLVSDLAHLYYRLIPEATSSADKVLSVNELKGFKSIDDALQFVISRRVDDLVRGSIDDWHKFFNARMNIELDGLVSHVAQWREFFQRRHIMVHAGGRVTERYVASVDWDRLGDAPPPVGKKLDLDDDYIARAINAFEVSGLLLSQEVWKKYAPDETRLRLDRLTGGRRGAVYSKLLSRNWYVAEHLANWGARDSDAPEDVMLICKFNRWLCIKRQGRWEEVRKEVQAFDTAAKHPKY